MNNDKVIPYANDADDGLTCFEFHFGAYGSTVVRVYADHLGDAFEVAVEWLDDNAPGLLVSYAEFEELRQEAAKELGLPWCDPAQLDDEVALKIQEHAERDLTRIGHTTLKHGTYIASWEWTADEVEP